MWSAILNNGLKVDESSRVWSGIKKDIKALSYSFGGVEVVLPPLDDKTKEYLQFKSASAPLSGGEISIESQTVGFRLDNGTKVLLKFNFKNNKTEIIVE